MNTCTRIIGIALLFALFVMFSNNSLCAQQRGRGRGGQSRGGPGGPPGAAPRTLLPPEFDNRPFDITLQQLPPQYLGCDAELVYTRIKNGQASGKEGGLEAVRQDTRQDQKTSAQGPPLPVARTLDLQSTYAFRFNPEERFYSAQDKILQVYCPFSTVLENGKEDGTRRGLSVKYQPRVDNKLITTNAQGTRVEFEELKFREYLVTFANFKEFPVEKNRTESIMGKIHVLPANAAQLEENMAVLLVCTLVDPYIASDSVQQKPTPAKPRDYFAQYYYLNVHLLELWFYDFNTGKVLLKIKAGQASQEP